MKTLLQALAPVKSTTTTAPTPLRERLPRGVMISSLILIICFAIPLYQWGRFAYGSELYSYALLIPVVSAYLFSIAASDAAVAVGRKHRLFALFLFASGLLALAAYLYTVATGIKLAQQNSVSLTTLSFVLLVGAIFCWGMNRAQLKQAAFPLAFLLFMVPFPTRMEYSIETFLQYGSAPPAYWLFQLIGTPVYREDLVFQLPGMTLQIAPECSGIRSTLVLFMTSLVAGQIFLRSPGKRALLAFAVIPLALVRNGFRVFTIGQLCVQVGPHMIDSFVHHRGGPIFFALSLIPFFGLVYLLVRSDRMAAPAKP